MGFGIWRINLSRANLGSANLSLANLKGANLGGAVGHKLLITLVLIKNSMLKRLYMNSILNPII